MTDKKNVLSDGDISEIFTNIGRAKEDTARGIMEERKKQEDERRNRRQGNVVVGDITFSDDIDLDALEKQIDNKLAIARKGIPKEELDSHQEMELDEPVVSPEDIPDVEEKDFLGDTSGEEPTVLELADTMSGEVMGNIYADDEDKSSEVDISQPAADVPIDISDEDLVIEIGENDFCVEANEEEKENPQCPIEYNSSNDISIMGIDTADAVIDSSPTKSDTASEISTEEMPVAAEEQDEITEFDFSDGVDDTSIISIYKTKVVLGAVWHGKVTTAALYSMMIIHLVWLNIPAVVSNVIIGLCVAIMLLSFVLYGIRNVRMIVTGHAES